MSSDNDPQSAVIAPRLFGSTGNHRDSVIPDELEKSGLERYEDEIERIQDAIADSNWYASEEHVNEDDYDRPTGDHIHMAIILRCVNIVIIVIIILIYST